MQNSDMDGILRVETKYVYFSIFGKSLTNEAFKNFTYVSIIPY